MKAEEIAKKYVYGNHDALTDRQEIKDMTHDIEQYAATQEGGECYVEVKCSDELPPNGKEVFVIGNYPDSQGLRATGFYNQSDWHVNDVELGFAVHTWLKPAPLPQISETVIADVIETYFKKWNGNGFDKPTPLERQGFEACANAITQLMKGE